MAMLTNLHKEVLIMLEPMSGSHAVDNILEEALRKESSSWQLAHKGLQRPPPRNMTNAIPKIIIA